MPSEDERELKRALEGLDTADLPDIPDTSVPEEKDKEEPFESSFVDYSQDMPESEDERGMEQLVEQRETNRLLQRLVDLMESTFQ
jgi:hypothetical protein